MLIPLSSTPRFNVARSRACQQTTKLKPMPGIAWRFHPENWSRKVLVSWDDCTCGRGADTPRPQGQAESGAPVLEVCRKMEGHRAIFYPQRKKFLGMGVAKVGRGPASPWPRESVVGTELRREGSGQELRNSPQHFTYATVFDRETRRML